MIVYRCYDAEGRLLYIGSTDDIRARMRYHRLRSPWWPFHTHVTTEHHAGRHAARAAETAAIAAEHPRWNVKDRSPDHPEGRISHAYGRFAAPWLRDDIEAWRAWRNDLESA